MGEVASLSYAPPGSPPPTPELLPILPVLLRERHLVPIQVSGCIPMMGAGFPKISPASLLHKASLRPPGPQRVPFPPPHVRCLLHHGPSHRPGQTPPDPHPHTAFGIPGGEGKTLGKCVQPPESAEIPHIHNPTGLGSSSGLGAQIAPLRTWHTRMLPFPLAL